MNKIDTDHIIELTTEIKVLTSNKFWKPELITDVRQKIEELFELLPELTASYRAIEKIFPTETVNIEQRIVPSINRGKERSYGSGTDTTDNSDR